MRRGGLGDGVLDLVAAVCVVLCGILGSVALVRSGGVQGFLVRVQRRMGKNILICKNISEKRRFI